MSKAQLETRISDASFQSKLDALPVMPPPYEKDWGEVWVTFKDEKPAGAIYQSKVPVVIGPRYDALRARLALARELLTILRYGKHVDEREPFTTFERIDAFLAKLDSEGL